MRRKASVLRHLAIACTMLLVGVVSSGQEPIQPPLPVDQSALNKIAALEPNQAAIIGEARVVGDFNEVARRYHLDKTGPRGRDYSIRMVWAPERKRALFCGANHGVPHRLNDVWEFDLAAMTWLMLYAPDNPRSYGGLGKDFSDVEFRDGILITKRGGPVVIGHTWWGLTYDPRHRRMLFLNTWVTNVNKAVKQVGGDPARIYRGPPVWSFEPQTGQWRFVRTKPPYPRTIFGGMLEYVPELGGVIWHANNWQMRATWLLDLDTKSWKDLKANGSVKTFQQQAPMPEQIGYYDPKRKQLIVHRYYDTFHYDVETNAWNKVLSGTKESGRVPYGHDARSVMHYDPKSGHGLLVEFGRGRLWAYDPDKVQWTELHPRGAPMPRGSKLLAYFDPARNVFVVIDRTTVWAYRYR